MNLNWTEIGKYVSAQRADIVEKLAQFAVNDVMLFWSTEPELKARQQEQWLPVLHRVEKELGLELKITDSFETPKENAEAIEKMKTYLSALDDRRLAAIYIAAVHMRSVLLALAMAKGEIDAVRAFELSELEEIYQVEKWGKDPEAEARRHDLLESVKEAEAYLEQ